MIRTFAVALTVQAAMLGVSARANEPDLVPDLRDLESGEKQADPRAAMRLFENVINTARTSGSRSVEENIAYNKQRKREIAAELAARQETLARLNDVVSIQYDRIRSQFDDDVPADILPTMRQLYHQHEVTRSQLEREIEDLQSDAVSIDMRIARGAVDREVERLNQELANPHEAFRALHAKDRSASENEQAEIAFLQRLSDERVARRAGKIGMPTPTPMLPAVIEHLIRNN